MGFNEAISHECHELFVMDSLKKLAEHRVENYWSPILGIMQVVLLKNGCNDTSFP